ncbi:MAG: transcriptional repressor [Patescibacteria group bacterium]
MARHMTEIRAEIISQFEKHHLLSATEIQSSLEKKFPSLNKTTVYRSLDFFIQTGLICQHQFGLKEALFELRTHHHDHLVCTHCGRLQTTSCLTELPKVIDGYQVEHHHLTVYGTCLECQKKTQPTIFQG